MNDDTYLRLEIVSTTDGTQVIYRRRRLLGPSPRSSQIRRLPRRFEEQTLYLCISPLLGEGLKSILDDIPRTSALLCVEYEPPLQPLWQEGPIATAQRADVKFATTMDDAVEIAAKLIGPRGVRRVVPVSLSGAARLHTDRYQQTQERIGLYIHQHWKNRGTEIRLGRRWIANLWRNVTVPSQNWGTLSTGRHHKAVIVGAGPSLDHHADLIQRVASSSHYGEVERPLIVALDTALPALAARDIPIDIVVAMDGQLANTADLVPFRWYDATLIADATVHPTVPRMFPPSRRFFFVTQFTDTSLFSSNPHAPVLFAPAPWMPVVPPRGSIAPTAVEVLSRFGGIKDIVTLGIDFHYRLPKTHACMSAPHRRFLRDHTRRTGTDGVAEALFRPWRHETLTTGASTFVDGILADQAKQFSSLVYHLSLLGTRVRTLPGDRVDIGTGLISEAEFNRWTRERSTESQRAKDPGVVRGDSGEQYDTESVRNAYERLVAQETILADSTRGAFLDADLTWAWFDIPQWPIVARRRDWIESHRDRVLRGVRDQRRRIERTIRAAEARGNRA